MGSHQPARNLLELGPLVMNTTSDRTNAGHTTQRTGQMTDEESVAGGNQGEHRLLIQEIVDFVTINAGVRFGDRCHAVYLMGSLARGGFSPAASDIDLGIVLTGPLHRTDPQAVDRLANAAQALNPQVTNRVSIFWGSVGSINGTVDGGRFPPFDRLDLIDHGRHLSGNDVRGELIRPTFEELIVAGADFALGYLATPERLAEFANIEGLAESGVVHLTKTVLFPARFLYLEHTGEVAGNDESASSYCSRFSGPDAELVARAHRWRTAPLPAEDEISSLLRAGLIPLYRRFLDHYQASLESHNQPRLAERLQDWQTLLRTS